MKAEESRRVFEGKLISVDVERWGGHEREVVHHPGAVAIVAIDGAGRVTLVRQLREPTRKRLLELPAGTREPDEEPLEDEKIELVRVAVGDLESLLPEIEDAKTLVGLLLYLRER